MDGHECLEILGVFVHALEALLDPLDIFFIFYYEVRVVGDFRRAADSRLKTNQHLCTLPLRAKCISAIMRRVGLSSHISIDPQSFTLTFSSNSFPTPQINSLRHNRQLATFFIPERAIHFRDGDGGGCSDEAKGRGFSEVHRASEFHKAGGG